MQLDDRKDILILLLYSPGIFDRVNEPIISRIRFVKFLFLFREEELKHFQYNTKIDENNFYNFFPWKFGPFSMEVHNDIIYLLLHNYIQIESINEDTLEASVEEYELWYNQISDVYDNVFEEESFSLTEKGLDIANKLYDLLTSSQKNHLKAFKVQNQKFHLRSLLGYVHKKYPSMTKQFEVKKRTLQF